MMPLRAASVCAAIVVSVAAYAQSPPPPVRIVVTPEARIAWRGIGVEEAAGAQVLAMLYPAPSAGGLLAAIFTHALIVQGGRAAARSQNQTAADKVLEPHSTPIAEMTLARAIDETLALARLAERIEGTSAVATPTTGTWIQISPTFAMAPDRRVIVLDSAIKIFQFDAAEKPRFENIVRVVSSPRLEPDPLKTWTEEDGKALRALVVELIAHSLDVALTIAFADERALPARTQRYQFGLNERMERGHPVAFTCGRVVLRTLREWLMSVPIGVPYRQAVCAEPYRLEVAAPG